VEVGRGGPRAFSRAVGHPAEFIPVNDPSPLRAGDTLTVRLLYRGKPLGAARARAGVASAESTPAPQKDVALTTDADGVVRVPVGEPGLWNVRTIHIVPADSGSGADWDVHWSTLVFRVGPGPTGAASFGRVSQFPSTQQRDSAAVAAAVERYHAWLAAGDSAGALALLTADAVIVESGGVETREEYRSHHLPGDIAFARAVKRERGAVRIVVRGDVAWATSTSTTVGEYRGRQINSAGAELMVLTRAAHGWRIAAIHWSSRARRSPTG